MHELRVTASPERLYTRGPHARRFRGAHERLAVFDNVTVGFVHRKLRVCAENRRPARRQHAQNGGCSRARRYASLSIGRAWHWSVRRILSLWVRVTIKPDDAAARIAAGPRPVCYVLERESQT